MVLFSDRLRSDIIVLLLVSPDRSLTPLWSVLSFTDLSLNFLLVLRRSTHTPGGPFSCRIPFRLRTFWNHVGVSQPVHSDRSSVQHTTPRKSLLLCFRSARNESETRIPHKDYTRDLGLTYRHSGPERRSVETLEPVHGIERQRVKGVESTIILYGVSHQHSWTYCSIS